MNKAESEKMKKMIVKADALISSMAMRKNNVTNLLLGNNNFLYDLAEMLPNF